MNTIRNILLKIKDFYYIMPIKRKTYSLFASMVIVVLIITISVSAKFSSTTVLNKTIENTLLRLTLVEERIDSFIDNTENLSKSIVTNLEVQRILSKGTSDAVSYTEDLIISRNILNNFIEPNTRVNNAILMKASDNNLFFSGMIDDINNKDNFLKDIKDFHSSKMISSWENMSKGIYKINNIDMDAVLFNKKVFDLNTGKLLGSVLMAINEESITKLYSDILVSKTGQVFICDKSGVIISTGDKYRLFSSISSEQYYNWVLESTNMGRVFAVNNAKQLVISKKCGRIDWMIVGVIPLEEVTGEVNRLLLALVVIGIVCLLISVILSRILAYTITNPLNILKKSIESASEGDLEVRVNLNTKDEIAYLGNEFNKMLQKISSLLDHVAAEQKKKREYELDLMQSQIKPHFLYNTLESICGLIDMQMNTEAVSTVNNLAWFYRGVLSKGSTIISISEEISIMDNYLKLLKVRYPELFDYSIDIDDEISCCSILKLTLQPIVENSVNHGFRHNPGRGILTVKGFISEDKVYISISDNGCGMEQKKINEITGEDAVKSGEKPRYGLMSTNQRIKLYFGQEYGLDIRSVLWEGTSITVILPKKRLGDMDDD